MLLEQDILFEVGVFENMTPMGKHIEQGAVLVPSGGHTRKWFNMRTTKEIARVRLKNEVDDYVHLCSMNRAELFASNFTLHKFLETATLFFTVRPHHTPIDAGCCCLNEFTTNEQRHDAALMQVAERGLS